MRVLSERSSVSFVRYPTSQILRCKISTTMQLTLLMTAMLEVEPPKLMPTTVISAMISSNQRDSWILIGSVNIRAVWTPFYRLKVSSRLTTDVPLTWSTMPVATAFVSPPLGFSIPYLTPHAVSVSLPTWRDNVGYEEGEKRVVEAMQTGYPRFFVHRSIQKVRPGGLGRCFRNADLVLSWTTAGYPHINLVITDMPCTDADGICEHDRSWPDSLRSSYRRTKEIAASCTRQNASRRALYLFWPPESPLFTLITSHGRFCRL